MKVELFRYGGATLRFRRFGEAGPAVVLIHGLSGSWRWWRRNVDALQAGRQVYVLDLSGYGTALSWRERSLGVQGDAELLAAWLRARDLHGVTLIGHSMGGHIAVRLTALEPQRVSHLVLACASGLLESTPARAALLLPRALVTGRPSFVPVVLAD